MLEVDLSIFGDLELPESKDEETEDAETNELGFKPIVPNAIAKEIDASINSHMPLEYRLRKITITKPDYSGVLGKQQMSMSRIQMDPRLRRYANSVSAVAKKEPSPAKVILEQPKEEPSKPVAAAATPDNVYNPMKDLHSRPKPVQDVYSPTQDVQDLYHKSSPSNQGYNPRGDLLNLNANPGWENTNGGFYGESSTASSSSSQPSVAAPPPVIRGDPRTNRRDPRQRRD